jgi:hypothetical protein
VCHYSYDALLSSVVICYLDFVFDVVRIILRENNLDWISMTVQLWIIYSSLFGSLSKFTIKMLESSDGYESCLDLLAEHWPKDNSSAAAAESELWQNCLSLVGLWDNGHCLAVAVIEPQHRRFELSDDLEPKQIDTCLMIRALAM